MNLLEEDKKKLTVLKMKGSNKEKVGLNHNSPNIATYNEMITRKNNPSPVQDYSKAGELQQKFLH